jgi:small subunit ribosomal protein S14
MARKAMIEKYNRKPKYKIRKKNRCKICGRPRGYLRRFDMCRICFRKLANNGLLPGVIKSSW